MLKDFVTQIANFSYENFLYFLVGIIAGIALVLTLHKTNLVLLKKEYGYVNLETIIADVNKALLSEQKNTHEIEAKLKLAKKSFDSLLKGYSKRHNMVILSSQKVIAGATDLTSYFSKKLIEQLKLGPLK